MKILKKFFEDLWFTNVSTYINSGNVIFESAKKIWELERKTLEESMSQHFGFSIPCLVIESTMLKKIAEKIPQNWENNADQKTDVLFLWQEYNSEETLKLIHINPDVDTLMYIDGAIVWHVDKKYYNQSKMHDFIGTKVYKNMTARNVNTVRKLVSL